MVPLGHYLDDTGHSVFRVFAPDVAQLTLQLAGQESPLPMEKQANGYWTLRLPQLAEGSRYRYRVNGTPYPDPASRAQPDGVHGPSAVAYPPSVDRSGWTGIAIEDAIINHRLSFDFKGITFTRVSQKRNGNIDKLVIFQSFNGQSRGHSPQ